MGIGVSAAGSNRDRTISSKAIRNCKVRLGGFGISAGGQDTSVGNEDARLKRPAAEQMQDRLVLKDIA